jgi:hypothetical protein
VGLRLAHGAAGGRGVKSEELDHIRADVRQAIVEAQQHDPTVTVEILWRLFDQLAEAVTSPAEAFAGSWAMSDEAARWDVELWAEEILRDVQTRAISKIPYGEAHPIEQEDHRDQPRA